MLLVAGIDPGLSGAIAIYDQEADALCAVWDIPTVKVQIGGSTRKRLDMAELRGMFDTMVVMDVKLIVIEKVQGYGEQNAAASFAFGEVFGRIMSLAETVAPCNTPTPGVWKLREKVPLDAKAIVAKAETEFSAHVALFRGPKNGPLHDRAEAAFMARYAARRIWPTLNTSYAVGDTLAVVAGEPNTGDVQLPAPAVRRRAKPTGVAKPNRKARKAK